MGSIMKLTSEALRELYQRETARSARHSATECLSEDLLARAVAGELNRSERERTADHLATCSDCVKEYRAISSLKSWAEEAAKTSAASENGDAPRIKLVVSPDPIPFALKPPARSLSFYLPYGIAAASVILSLTFGYLLISKSRENQRLVAQVNQEQSTRIAGANETAESRRLLEESTRRAEQESAARRAAEEELAKRVVAAKSPTSNRRRTEDQVSPDVNVPIFDLVPQDGRRGEPLDQSTMIELPAGTDLFTLILNLTGQQSSSDYSLQIVDQNNRAIWTSRGLRKSAYNNFTIAMRRTSFPAGEYRLKLYGLSDGRRELIEQYAIRLVYR